MKDIFANYELVKLGIFDVDYVNTIVILFFFILILMTNKKGRLDEDENGFLSPSHTDQLRGIAIFFVILGHLWVHVSKTRALFIFSGDAVSLFLIISGFGLAMSTMHRPISFKDFFLKRIKRVMLPYWIVTILIIILDYLILKRTLKFDSLILTFLGMNTSIELQHLDYVRWFVTFILFWYLLFYTIILKYKTKRSLVYLFAISFALLPLNYYVFHFGWYQFFSFPVGCFLAVYYKEIKAIYQKYKSRVIVLSVCGMTYVLIFKFIMSSDNIYSVVLETFPTIILTYVSDGNSVVISLACLILVGRLIELGFNSQVLLFLGKYSYELFLLHGIFLIKYNPIIKGYMPFDVFIHFLLFLLFVTAISVLTHKTHTAMYEKK